LLALLAAGGVGWYYSGQILGPDAAPAIDESEILAATDTSITLAPDGDRDARSTAVTALEWPGGFGELTEVLGADSGRVTRRFRAIAGRPAVGSRASARPYAFAADPLTLHGIPFEVVALATPAGACSAWVMRAPGVPAPGPVAAGSGVAAPPDSAWMIFVHGRRAVRAQALRVAPLFLGLGWNVMAIAYRNHEGAARSGDGRYRLGAEEWRELEGAVQWAVDHGARRVVLTGYSMGGAIVLQFLRRSPLAARVEGAILDGPVLRWRPVLDLAAKERGVHPILTSLGTAVTAWRAGLRWEDLDLLAHAPEYRVPLLVFHGSADPTVPAALSDSLAERRPDLVTVVRVIDAGHVRCWNADPRGYEAAIASWLGRLDRR